MAGVDKPNSSFVLFVFFVAELRSDLKNREPQRTQRAWRGLRPQPKGAAASRRHGGSAPNPPRHFQGMAPMSQVFSRRHRRACPGGAMILHYDAGLPRPRPAELVSGGARDKLGGGPRNLILRCSAKSCLRRDKPGGGQKIFAAREERKR